MQIPNIPTDNLYKFMAITGVIILIICYATLYYSMDKINKDMTELSHNLDITGIDMEYFTNDIYRLDKISDILISKMPDSIQNLIHAHLNDTLSYDSVGPSILWVDYLLEAGGIKDPNFIAYLNAYKVTVQRQIDFDKTILNAKFIQKKIKNRFRIYIIQSIISFLFMIGGYILAHSGFKKWYDRHQKYQDIIIKNQSEKINE